MTTYLYPNSKIAASYDNSGALVAWESIVPTGGTRFFAPVLYGNFDPGQEDTLTDGNAYFEGYAVINGSFGALTQVQLYYLQTTYCNSGYSGPVTIECRTESPNNYLTFNAVLRLTKLSESQKKSMAYENYKFLFTRLRPIV